MKKRNEKEKKKGRGEREIEEEMDIERENESTREWENKKTENAIAKKKKYMQIHRFKSDSGHFQIGNNYSTVFHALERVSKRTSERSMAREYVHRRAQLRQTARNELCKRTIKRMSEWPITYIPISRGSESL